MTGSAANCAPGRVVFTGSPSASRTMLPFASRLDRFRGSFGPPGPGDKEFAAILADARNGRFRQNENERRQHQQDGRCPHSRAMEPAMKKSEPPNRLSTASDPAPLMSTRFSRSPVIPIIGSRLEENRVDAELSRHGESPTQKLAGSESRAATIVPWPRPSPAARIHPHQPNAIQATDSFVRLRSTESAGNARPTNYGSPEGGHCPQPRGWSSTSAAGNRLARERQAAEIAASYFLLHAENQTERTPVMAASFCPSVVDQVRSATSALALAARPSRTPGLCKR